jgi:LL-diaminopimelate aminotransferase
LLEEADLVTTPGLGFGDAGNGFFRMALTVDSPRLEEAVARISKLSF